MMDRTFDEDGPGVEYALLDQCFDDRSTNLTVHLEDAGDAVVSARMEGNRLILTPRSEQSGTQRTTITVSDDAGATRGRRSFVWRCDPSTIHRPWHNPHPTTSQKWGAR